MRENKMKKLLGVSIAAMLAVTPMLANATNPAAAVKTDTPYAGVDEDATAKIATTSYVQGAYNAVVGMANDLDSRKQNNLMNGTGQGAQQVSSTVATTVRAATGENAADNTTLVTEKAVRDAIDAVNTANTTTAGDGIAKNGSAFSVDYTADKGLAWSAADGNGHKKLEIKAGNGIALDSTGVKVNYTADTGLTNNANTGALEIKDGAGIKTGSNGIEVDLKTNGGLDIDNGQIKVVADGTTISLNDSGELAVNGALYDAAGAATGVQSAIEGKLDDGAAGYNIDANTLKIQGNDVATQNYVTTATTGMATQTGVNKTIESSYVPVYTAWGTNTYTNVGITAAAYTTTGTAIPQPGEE